MSNNLTTRPLSGLASECAEQSNRFFNKQPHDPACCYELFRRAFEEQDTAAWEMVFQQYYGLVVSWVTHNQAFADSGESVDRFVNDAFAKMWRAVTPIKFASFSKLSELLSYLKMCVGSVLADHARARHNDIPFEELSDEPNFEDESNHDPLMSMIHHEFWRIVLGHLKDEREIAVIEGTYVLGLKPRHLLEKRAALFKNVSDIYRVKENVLQRLRRDDNFKRELLANA